MKIEILIPLIYCSIWLLMILGAAQEIGRTQHKNGDNHSAYRETLKVIDGSASLMTG